MPAEEILDAFLTATTTAAATAAASAAGITPPQRISIAFKGKTAEGQAREILEKVRQAKGTTVQKVGLTYSANQWQLYDIIEKYKARKWNTGTNGTNQAEVIAKIEKLLGTRDYEDLQNTFRIIPIPTMQYKGQTAHAADWQAVFDSLQNLKNHLTGFDPVLGWANPGCREGTFAIGGGVANTIPPAEKEIYDQQNRLIQAVLANPGLLFSPEFEKMKRSILTPAPQATAGDTTSSSSFVLVEPHAAAEAPAAAAAASVAEAGAKEETTTSFDQASAAIQDMQNALGTLKEKITLLSEKVDLKTLEPGYYIRCINVTLPGGRKSFHIYGIEVTEGREIWVHENINPAIFHSHVDKDFYDQLMELNKSERVLYRDMGNKGLGLSLQIALATEMATNNSVEKKVVAVTYFNDENQEVTVRPQPVSMLSKITSIIKNLNEIFSKYQESRTAASRFAFARNADKTKSKTDNAQSLLTIIESANLPEIKAAINASIEFNKTQEGGKNTGEYGKALTAALALLKDVPDSVPAAAAAASAPPVTPSTQRRE